MAGGADRRRSDGADLVVRGAQVVVGADAAARRVGSAGAGRPARAPCDAARLGGGPLRTSGGPANRLPIDAAAAAADDQAVPAGRSRDVAGAPRRVEVVAPDAVEVRGLLPVVHAQFNEAERLVERDYGHPITRRAREGILPTVEAVYAYGDSPRVYYVEAIRPYRRLGQTLDECTAVGSGTGWFARDAAGVRTLTMVVDVLTCRREAGSYMLPLGVLKLNDRVYWLAQFSGWDHERYVVLEIKKKSVDVVVNTWAGVC